MPSLNGEQKFPKKKEGAFQVEGMVEVKAQSESI